MNRKSEKSDFMVPLNSVKSGHLVFLSNTARMTFLADPRMSELARGSFDHIPPRVRVEEDTIMIQYRDFLSLNVREHLQKYHGIITLNPSMLWEIEFRECLSYLHADMRVGEIRQFCQLQDGGQRLKISKNGAPRPRSKC